jgi:hypothetical protein
MLQAAATLTLRHGVNPLHNKPYVCGDTQTPMDSLGRGEKLSDTTQNLFH